MENKKPVQFQFKQIETGLGAFIANFEAKLNDIYPDIPVMVLDTGDETYFLKEKFEKTKEIYLQVPRVTISINDIEFQTDQDSNQYVKFIYKFIGRLFKAQFRRKTTNLPVVCNFVCSNFIKALEYLEVLACILAVDNIFTYNYMGSVYSASFNLTSFSLEKNPIEVGGSKNFVIKANIDLQLQLMLVKYNTIQDVTDSNGGSGLTPEFNIKDKNGDIDYETVLKPFSPEIPDNII